MEQGNQNQLLSLNSRQQTIFLFLLLNALKIQALVNNSYQSLGPPSYIGNYPYMPPSTEFRAAPAPSSSFYFEANQNIAIDFPITYTTVAPKTNTIVGNIVRKLYQLASEGDIMVLTEESGKIFYIRERQKRFNTIKSISIGTSRSRG